MRLLKMCPESECVLASSGKLDGWWDFWKCVQTVSAFWLLLASWMADEASENVSSMWVCSGLIWQVEWGFFWKCVQYVSVFWLDLASWIANETSFENVSSMWVCSGCFWQAECLMRLLWNCVQEVSVFWLLLASCMAHEASSENLSREWAHSASSGKLDDW